MHDNVIRKIPRFWIITNKFKINTHNFHNSNLFYIPHFSQKYMLNDPVSILMSSGNNQVINKLFT